MFPRKLRLLAPALALFLVGGWALWATAAEPDNDKPTAGGLSLDEFEKVHGQMVKMSKEGVWSIPWQLSIREARLLAAKEKKPLLLWRVCDGSPLSPC